MTMKTNFKAMVEDLENSRNRNKPNFTQNTTKYLTPGIGDTRFMILPPQNDESGIPYVAVNVHFGFTDSTGKNRAYQCSKKKHRKCPICDLVNEKYNRINDLQSKGISEGIKELEDEIKQIKAKKFFLYNAVDLNLENVLLTLKPLSHNHIVLALSSYYDETQEDPTDPINGVIVKLTRTTREPFATSSIVPKPIQVTEQEKQKVLSKRYDLSKVYVDYTPEDLAKMLSGEDIVTPAKEDENKAEATKVETKVETPKEEVKPVVVKKAVEKKVATPKVEEKPVVAEEKEEDDELAKLEALLGD